LGDESVEEGLIFCGSEIMTGYECVVGERAGRRRSNIEWSRESEDLDEGSGDEKDQEGSEKDDT
jgi:hypothetical protein